MFFHALLSATTDEEARTHAQHLKRIETRYDAFVGEIIDLLDAAPQPPFDWDDIIRLAKQLDDVIDGVERAGSRFVIYRGAIKGAENVGAVLQLADVVGDAARVVQDALAKLKRQRRQVVTSCMAIHSFEGQADTIYHRSLATWAANILCD